MTAHKAKSIYHLRVKGTGKKAKMASYLEYLDKHPPTLGDWCKELAGLKRRKEIVEEYAKKLKKRGTRGR